MTFFEQEMQRLFGESEQLSSNTVFSNKTMLGGIGKNLRAKVQFISTNVSNHYDALKLTIINREQGQIDIETFRFVDIIGKKNGYEPYIWDDYGKANWYGFEPTHIDYCRISNLVEDYISMYSDHQMNFDGMSMGGI